MGRKKQERKDAAKSEMARIEEAINEVKKRKEIEREKFLRLLKKGEHLRDRKPDRYKTAEE